jgi:hypothetical protein
MIFRKKKEIRELKNYIDSLHQMLNFRDKIYKEYGLPLWHELYWLTQPQPQPMEMGERLMAEFKNKYNIGEDNKIKIQFKGYRDWAGSYMYCKNERKE